MQSRNSGFYSPPPIPFKKECSVIISEAITGQKLNGIKIKEGFKGQIPYHPDQPNGKLRECNSDLQEAPEEPDSVIYLPDDIHDAGSLKLQSFLGAVTSHNGYEHQQTILTNQRASAENLTCPSDGGSSWLDNIPAFSQSEEVQGLRQAVRDFARRNDPLFKQRHAFACPGSLYDWYDSVNIVAVGTIGHRGVRQVVRAYCYQATLVCSREVKNLRGSGEYNALAIVNGMISLRGTIKIKVNEILFLFRMILLVLGKEQFYQPSLLWLIPHAQLHNDSALSSCEYYEDLKKFGFTYSSQLKDPSTQYLSSNLTLRLNAEGNNTCVSFMSIPVTWLSCAAPPRIIGMHSAEDNENYYILDEGNLKWSKEDDYIFWQVDRFAQVDMVKQVMAPTRPSKICLIGGCRGAIVPGQNWARHLRQAHQLTDDEIRRWRQIVGARWRYLRDDLRQDVQEIRAQLRKRKTQIKPLIKRRVLIRCTNCEVFKRRERFKQISVSFNQRIECIQCIRKKECKPQAMKSSSRRNENQLSNDEQTLKFSCGGLYKSGQPATTLRLESTQDESPVLANDARTAKLVGSGTHASGFTRLEPILHTTAPLKSLCLQTPGITHSKNFNQHYH